MNSSKWKSVVLPIRTYATLRAMAKAEERTISGQFKYILNQALARKIEEECRDD